RIVGSSARQGADAHRRRQRRGAARLAWGRGAGLMARVLDLTSAVGAYATRLLAELGHDVVRIEPPDGDELRRLAPHLDGAPRAEASAFHQFLNAGKRSFAADLATETGKRQLLAL